MQWINDAGFTVFQAEQLLSNVEAALQNIYALNAVGAALDLTQLLERKVQLELFIKRNAHFIISP
jgi:hypothetical protein